MVDHENPPPPSGETFEFGKWDKSGIAYQWRRFTLMEKLAPITQGAMLALIGVVFGMVGTLVTSSIQASRSEAFQWEQEQRTRIDIAIPKIYEMLDIVGEQDIGKLDKALRRIENSTRYLPAYTDLLLSMNVAYTGMQLTQTHYQIQSINVDTNEIATDSAEIEKMESDGWKEISQAALNIKLKLRLSNDPYALKCISDLCQKLAL